MKLSIIIPVFNEEKTILQVLDRVVQTPVKKVNKEIIVVDDGSKDNTAESIYKFLKKKNTNNVFFYRHKKNAGKGSAVKTGIQKATGDYIVIQDADLEYDPKYFTDLLQPIFKHEADIVFGTRLKHFPRLTGQEPFYFLPHFLGNRFLSLMTSLLFGKWVTDMETCYKLFPRKAMKEISLHAKGFDLEPELTAKLFKLPLRFKEVPIVTKPRSYNEGKKLIAIKEGPKAMYALLKYRFS